MRSLTTLDPYVFFFFQITECGKRGNQLTTVVVADQVEDVAIKDVSMLFGYQCLKLHFS